MEDDPEDRSSLVLMILFIYLAISGLESIQMHKDSLGIRLMGHTDTVISQWSQVEELVSSAIA